MNFIPLLPIWDIIIPWGHETPGLILDIAEKRQHMKLEKSDGITTCSLLIIYKCYASYNVSNEYCD